MTKKSGGKKLANQMIKKHLVKIDELMSGGGWTMQDIYILISSLKHLLKSAEKARYELTKKIEAQKAKEQLDA